jgi:alkylation response protein AidB-like acyl-CoA dehydrogenase
LRGLGGSGREHEAYDERIAWNRHLAAHGWTCLGWPVEHGGRGLSLVQQVIFHEEYARADAPAPVNHLGEQLLGPTLIALGTRDQQARFLPRIRSVDELWCQGYSEPEAGSDLAGVRTRARREGDDWIIDGQKIWTSLAHAADWMFALVRTEPGSRRHAGLSYLLVPLHQDGIEIRPIRQLDGERKFNEVYLTDVRVGRDDLIGAEGEGWKVGLSVLGSERRMLGSIAIGLDAALWALRRDVEREGRSDPAFRDRWVALQTRAQLLRWTWFRYLSESDGTVDPRTSVLKLVSSELQQSVAQLARDGLGPSWAVDPRWESWRHQFLASHGATIAGGTSEIQRNILGERVLGLPR